MIELLSPQIANQIAAGEVVQRPASAVKELLENAVDAGARRVALECVDGGRTAVVVVDDGVGMDREDAQKAFLRHATSKIRTAEDLFRLRTFGFRGEALASIASVAEVELRTCRPQDPIGTRVVLSGGEVLSVDAADAPKGTSIAVRNLFFNIPARRKFLKSDRAEAAAVWNEFARVAMVNPDIEFVYRSNVGERTELVLPAGGLLQRVVGLTKASYSKKLLSVDLSTDLVRLTGYVGVPETAAAKTAQYLFVNGRYVRNPLLHKAVVQAYDRLVGHGTVPPYFLFLELSPAVVDANINPTKTEVKFEDDQAVFQTVYAAVKGCLGKANALEAMDFNEHNDPTIDIPAYVPARAEAPASMPRAHSGRPYNPFAYDATPWQADKERPEAAEVEQMPFREELPPDLPQAEPNQSALPLAPAVRWTAMILSARYAAVRTAEGLAVVDIPRAEHRIEYERTLELWLRGRVPSQGLLIPAPLELDPAASAALAASLDLVESLGFVVARSNEGWELHGAPDAMGAEELVAVAQSLAEEGTADGTVRAELIGRLAERATRGALYRTATPADPSEWIGRLMACNEPSYTPSGLKIIETVGWDELERRMV